MTLCLLNRFPCTLEDRLKKLNKIRKTYEVKFIKLKRKRKEELGNYNELSKKK